MSEPMNATNVITCKNTVFSYLTVIEPKIPLGGGTPKYSVSLIIPKSAEKTVQKIRAAIKAAYETGTSRLKGNSQFLPRLEDLRTPLRDGDKDRPNDPAYKDAWFINASSQSQPGLVGPDNNDLFEPREWYSGVIGRASINFFAYNTNGNRGIACGLNNLQKLKDGTPLGGRKRAQDDFANLDDDDDDDDDFLD